MHRYYEIVTYTRKLILGGLSIFIGRGSLAQVYFVVSHVAGDLPFCAVVQHPILSGWTLAGGRRVFLSDASHALVPV